MRPTLERILFGPQKMAYLLRDEFTDTLAAGAVNGTPAVPGPGTRTVVDTGNLMSITGGELVSTRTATSDPRFYLDSVSRVVGRTLKIKFKSNIINSVAQIGWGNNTGGILANYLDFAGTGIRTESAVIVAPAIAAGTYYEFAFSLRAAGCFYFIKGGIYTNWTLLWISVLNSTTPMYPGFSTGSNPATNTLDFLRSPQSLFYTPRMWYDSFTRANGVLGNSETISPDGQPIVALPWTAQVGTWAVSGNAAAASALAGGLAIATVPTNTPDVHLRIALTRAGGSVGGVARYQSSTDYLRISHDGTNALCEQVVAGVPTTLRTGAAAFSAGALIYLIVRGIDGWLFYNNAAIGASFTVPVSTFGAHGLYTTNTGNTMDNFEVTPDGNYANEHAALGKM